MLALPYLIERSEMPQIEESAYADLFAFLESKGIAIDRVTCSPDLLQCHQVMDSFEPKYFDASVMNKPVLISADYFVLDGNHRVAAHKAKEIDVDCYRLELVFGDAIEMLFEFPETYKVSGKA